MSDAIERLSGLHGIADSYLDYRGKPCEVSLESRAAILGALGIDARDGKAAEAAIHQHETLRWTRLLPPVVVEQLTDPLVVPVSVPLQLQAKSLAWTVTLEDGSTRTGRAELGPMQTLEEGSAEGGKYRRVALPLPDLPLGYHTAAIVLDTG